MSHNDDLRLFGKPKMSSSILLEINFAVEDLYWCKRSWKKVSFVDFLKMTCNAWACIFQMVHLLNLRIEYKLYGIVFFSKWALVGKFLINYEKVMLGQILVDFSYRNPNLPFLTFDGLGAYPWSNDGHHFKILMLTKNLEVWLYIGHCWLLT